MPEIPDAIAHRTSWLRPYDSDSEAEATVFLFHYSGGGVSMYSRWPDWTPPSVQCRRVQLPGRQDREAERPFTAIGPLVDAVCDVLAGELDDRPFVLFGHSMGALLAYRVALTLERSAAQHPALVGVSGWAPEGFQGPNRSLAGATDETIANLIERLGAAPAEDLARTALPPSSVTAMRADLAVCASYLDDGLAVRCPLVAYAGREDPFLAPGAMRSWQARGSPFLGVREFPGGHFFIHDQGPGIAADLVQLLRQHRPG